MRIQCTPPPSNPNTLPQHYHTLNNKNPLPSQSTQKKCLEKKNSDTKIAIQKILHQLYVSIPTQLLAKLIKDISAGAGEHHMAALASSVHNISTKYTKNCILLATLLYILHIHQPILLAKQQAPSPPNNTKKVKSKL